MTLSAVAKHLSVLYCVMILRLECYHEQALLHKQHELCTVPKEQEYHYTAVKRNPLQLLHV